MSGWVQTRTGGVVHPGVVGPLVEHMAGLLIHVLEHRVLGDQDKAEAGDQVVDAVVDLRVHVVGPACHHHDGWPFFRAQVDVLLAGLPDVQIIGVVGLVGGLRMAFTASRLGMSNLLEELGGPSSQNPWAGAGPNWDGCSSPGPGPGCWPQSGRDSRPPPDSCSWLSDRCSSKLYDMQGVEDGVHPSSMRAITWPWRSLAG